MLSEGSFEFTNNVSEEGKIPNGTPLASHALEVLNQVNKRALSSPRRGSNEKFDPPAFYQQLENEVVVDEGESLQLLTRVGPTEDHSLEINWYKDGKLLSAGSRFTTLIERGLIALDFMYTIEDDTGDYVCVAKSNSGLAESNVAHVKILPEGRIDYQTQLPEEMSQGINSFENASGESYSHEDDRHGPKCAPNFVQQPSSNVTLNQGQPLHIHMILDNYSDSSLTTEWFKDGQSVTTGSRINMTYDRGYCALDIAYCFPEDNGQYTCVAKNTLGQTSSHPVQLMVIPEESIVTKSNLTESSIRQLKSLENPGEEYTRRLDISSQPVPPTFTSSVEPTEITVTEGSPAYFKVTVDPGNGEKLSYDWYHNNEVVNTCSRLTGKLDMNVASLNILYTLPSDTGSYICVIFSEYGREESQSVTLNVQTERSIILDPQSKGIQAIKALEAELNAPKTEMKADEIITDIPTFTKQLEPVGQVNEGDSVFFSARVEPANDNTLYVEWHKDDNQLINGSRMRIEYHRGLATLNITSTISEDSGDYWLLARNRNGQAESYKVNLTCFDGERIVTSSNLLEDSEGFKRLKEMEEDLSNINCYSFKHVEDVEVECPPNFDVKPVNIIAEEGGPAKFLVKISGFPTPVVEWTVDGAVVVPDSLCKAYNDGSINYLEINRCLDLGDIPIHVTATNSFGTAEAEAILTVKPIVDFRPDLRHITPENPYKKIANLKKVECSSELNNAFRKSKPSAQQIVDIEKHTEMKSKSYKSSDVLETEKLYDQIASGLRKSGSNNGGRSPRNVHSGSPVNVTEEMPPPPPVNEE